MKGVRMLMIALALTAVLMVGGCAKYYRFDFIDEQDLTNAQGTWREYMLDGSKTFDPIHGIRLNNSNIHTPMNFTGDFTITVDFYLNLDESHYSDIGFVLCDKNFPDDFNQVFYFSLNKVGSPDENAYVSEWQEDPSLIKEHDRTEEPMVTLDRTGNNNFILEKNGDFIKITLNDVEEFGPYTLTYYTGDFFYPTLVAYQNFSPVGNYGVYFSKIEVKYE